MSEYSNALELMSTRLSAQLIRLGVDRDVKVILRIGPGSVDLVRGYSKGQHKTPLSNDTSYGSGFALSRRGSDGSGSLSHLGNPCRHQRVGAVKDTLTRRSISDAS